MNFRDIEAGNIIKLHKHGDKHICILTNDNHLVDVHTGWLEEESVSSEFDSLGCSNAYSDVYVEEIYSELNGYLTGSKPSWTRPKELSLKAGMQLRLRQGLTAGAVYGAMRCSEVAQHFSGELVALTKICLNNTLEVSYRDSKTFFVSLNMIDFGKGFENVVITEKVKNPFISQTQDFQF